MKRVADRPSAGDAVSARDEGHVRDYAEGVRPGFVRGMLQRWTTRGAAAARGRVRAQPDPWDWCEQMFACEPNGDDIRIGIFRSVDTPDWIHASGANVSYSEGSAEIADDETPVWVCYEVHMYAGTMSVTLGTATTRPAPAQGYVYLLLGVALTNADGRVVTWVEGFRKVQIWEDWVA